jgi:hypothetical protein
MSKQLPVEAATMLMELSAKSKAEVMQTVSCFGGDVDKQMSRKLMLELLFAILSENARAETGEILSRQNLFITHKPFDLKNNQVF